MAEGRSGRLAGGRDALGEEPGDDRNPALAIELKAL